MTPDLTIIVSPGSSKVCDHIAEWAAMGLLRDSVWIAPAELARPLTDVVELTVSHVGEKKADGVTLRSVLGDADLRLVRVLVVRGPVDDPDASGDSRHTEAVRLTWEFADRLRGALSSSTDLLRINVVVPSQPAVDPDLLDARCDVNVVVSPEDRPHDGAVDHGVGRAEIHPAHAALACATVGALWVDTETGAFDRPADPLARPGRIVVTRAAARVVDSNTLSARIIDRLYVDGPTSYQKYLPPDPNRTSDDSRLVEEVFHAFIPVEKKVMNYRPPPPPRERERRRSVAMTFGMVVRFLLQVLHLRLLEWQQEVRTQLDEAVVRWLSQVAGEGGGELPERLPPTADEMQQAAGSAPVNMKVNARLPGGTPAFQFLWPMLRRLCFGLCDGGDMPSDVAAKFGTLRPTVSHPRWVVPNSDQQHRFQLDEVERGLLANSKLPLNQLHVMDESTVDRLEQVLSSAVQAGEPPTPRSGISPAKAVQVLNGCLQRLRNWRAAAQQDPSLLGRLLKHVHEQMTLAKDALMKHREEYERQEAERKKVVGILEDIRDHLTRRMLILLAPLVFGVLSLAGIVFAEGGTLTRLFLTSTIICGLLVLVGALVVSATAERAAMLENQLEAIEVRRQHTVALVVEWPEEAQRLSSLYSIMLDWAEIISRLLYRPGGAEAGETGQPTSLELPRPEAFHLVQPSEELEEVTRLVAEAVFGPGWLSKLYHVVLDQAVPERSAVDGQLDARVEPDLAPGPPSKLVDPDEKQNGAVTNDNDGEDEQPVWDARGRLLRLLRREHDYLNVVTEYLRAHVGETLHELPPDQLAAMLDVTVVDANGTARQVNALDFLRRGLPPRAKNGIEAMFAPAVFSDAGMMNGRPKVSRVHLWGRTSQLAIDEPNQDGQNVVVAWPPADNESRSDVCRVALIRLDMSGDCDAEDLAMTLADHGGDRQLADRLGEPVREL